MSDDVPMFAGYEPEPAEQLSAGQRLTRRQRRDAEQGRHPLTRGPLHPDAVVGVPGSRSTPMTCGSCLHRDAHGYPKCILPGVDGKPIPARLSHSATTDVRAWWPACPDYEARP